VPAGAQRPESHGKRTATAPESSSIGRPADVAGQSNRPGDPVASAAQPAQHGDSAAPGVQPLAQSQPLVPAQPLAHTQPAAAPASPAQPAQPQPVAQQLAAPLLRLRAGGDGSHTLTIALHPADLGPVSVHVRLIGDAMTIQLASASESAHDVLREALPQLHQELQAAGLSSAGLSLQLSGQGADGSTGSAAHPQLPRPMPDTPTGTADLPAAGKETRRPRTAESSLDRWL
jgi:flagellar hook-length control protein FliK